MKIINTFIVAQIVLQFTVLWNSLFINCSYLLITANESDALHIHRKQLTSALKNKVDRTIQHMSIFSNLHFRHSAILSENCWMDPKIWVTCLAPE